MDKKEEALTQFESVINEIKKGQEESAATAVVGQRRGNPSILGAIFRLIYKLWGLRIILIALLLIVAIALGAMWIFSGSSFKQESTTFVENVRDLATLATAEAHVKVIIEQEDNKLFGKDISVNLPGTKRKLLLIVPATVIAGVDLKGITSDDIKVNHKEKRLTIILPRAALLQKPAIQMDKVRTFSDAGLLRGEVQWAEGFDLAAEAQEQIQEEAIEIGLLETAEQNAEKVLKEFFGHLDYTVELTFR